MKKQLVTVNLTSAFNTLLKHQYLTQARHSSNDQHFAVPREQRRLGVLFRGTHNPWLILGFEPANPPSSYKTNSLSLSDELPKINV